MVILRSGSTTVSQEQLLNHVPSSLGVLLLIRLLHNLPKVASGWYGNMRYANKYLFAQFFKIYVFCLLRCLTVR